MAVINPSPAKQSAARAYTAFNLASFVIGAKVTNTINVAVTLLGARGEPLQIAVGTDFFLSDTQNPPVYTTTPATSALAIGTNGSLVVTTTGVACSVLTNNAGQFDINVIQTATPKAYYPCILMPDGSIIIGPVVQF
jgi:hypothetical protein